MTLMGCGTKLSWPEPAKHITVSRGFLFSCEQVVRERARGKPKEA